MDHKVCNLRPTPVRKALRPCIEVNPLVTLQIPPSGLFGYPFELNRLFSTPSNNEGAERALSEVWVLSGSFYCIEDDLQFRSRSNSYKC